MGWIPEAREWARGLGSVVTAAVLREASSAFDYRLTCLTDGDAGKLIGGRKLMRPILALLALSMALGLPGCASMKFAGLSSTARDAYVPSAVFADEVPRCVTPSRTCSAGGVPVGQSCTCSGRVGTVVSGG